LVTVIKVAKFIATDVITPNGDAINDLWIIKDFGYYAPIDVSIYNRLGDVLFTSNNYQNDWDGKTNGESLPEGAYYYIVRTKQGDVYKGTINIIR
jgi:gliding motility-associated-like protein